MKTKRASITVINDLLTDQRADKMARTLMKGGYRVVLTGRRLAGSTALERRPYKLCRLRLIFNRGPWFYACYNTRLFFLLLFSRQDLLVACDMDTLLPNYWVSRIKGKKLIFDSHEYFSEVPEVRHRPRIKKFWQKLERKYIPKLHHVITVSPGIAEKYKEQFRVEPVVVMNCPSYERRERRRPEQLFCNPERTIVYQGVLNLGRGLENMILAMKHLDGFHLQLFGSGDLEDELKKLVEKESLKDRVLFMGRIPFTELRSYTRQASLGISLEEDLGLNYRYALPNKLFDYIHAGIPVLVSNLPEMRRIVEHYDIGRILKHHEPGAIASTAKEMLNDHEQRILWKKNLSRAARKLRWEVEEAKILRMIN